MYFFSVCILCIFLFVLHWRRCKRISYVNVCDTLWSSIWYTIPWCLFCCGLFAFIHLQQGHQCGARELVSKFNGCIFIDAHNYIAVNAVAYCIVEPANDVWRARAFLIHYRIEPLRLKQMHKRMRLDSFTFRPVVSSTNNNNNNKRRCFQHF